MVRKIEGVKVTGFYGRVVSTGKKTFEEVAKESARNTTLHEAEATLAANLLLDGIRDRLKEGYIVDPFMGSGTTAIAAIKEKRHFIGTELNKEYFDKAVRRIKAEQAQLTLF